MRSVVRPLLGLLAQLGELALQLRDQLVAIGESRLRLRLDCVDLGRRGVGDARNLGFGGRIVRTLLGLLPQLCDLAA